MKYGWELRPIAKKRNLHKSVTNFSQIRGIYLDTEIQNGCRVHSWLARLSQLTFFTIRFAANSVYWHFERGYRAGCMCSGLLLKCRFYIHTPSLSRCGCVRTFQTNAPATSSMTMVHARVNRTIQPVVMEDDPSTSETTMLLVEIEATCQERQQSRCHQVQLA